MTPPEASGRGAGRTILIADDSAAQRRFVELVLGLDGYRVVSVEDGGAALERMRAGPELPDLVVLDVSMRRMDGLSACARIKDDPALRHVPVVILTSLGDDATRRTAEASGADAFLTKPLAGAGFRDLVDRLVANAGRPGDDDGDGADDADDDAYGDAAPDGDG